MKREVEVDKEVKEDGGRKGKRTMEKGEDETFVKRKCVNPVSVEAFDTFSPGDISESGADSDCGSGDVVECACE